MKENAQEVALRVFREIEHSFPCLEMQIDKEPEHVDISVEIPKQDGLSFNVSLNLQNVDELHLNVGEHFWVEWFPCTEKQKEEDYINAVKGVLSGDYRIKEFYRGNKTVQAQLQKPNGNDWETITGWSKFHFPYPFTQTTKILKNAQPEA
ncbi:hypothetical protein P4C99_21775 [Pontiellaceae bacterium B1224]|nr:hypothetical protein [Pontiellaceae bacterium B1224]